MTAKTITEMIRESENSKLTLDQLIKKRLRLKGVEIRDEPMCNALELMETHPNWEMNTEEVTRGRERGRDRER